jgi:alkanesulfonate monooxygenase SsuD/methylene tetrahydromethanopterin reductase-like flavin-dependent oxidoreductase (luciferase family)
MDIGIGLPNVVPGTDGRAIVDWARRAEDAGFSSVGTIGRLVYPNYEELIALTAAAAVTERIGLVTAVLLGPLRRASFLAKQAASLNAISGGRLTLGMAVGGREDDYEVAEVPFHERGAIFDSQLDELADLFSGAERGGGHPLVPEASEPPRIVIGGQADRAFQRAARYGAGWIQGGGGPDAFAESLPKLDQAWSEAGRDGEPRRMALGYYSLGDDPEAQAKRSIGHYYAFLGDYADMIVESTLKSADAIKEAVSAYEGHGCDELILFPAGSDPAQVDLLRDALR